MSATRGVRSALVGNYAALAIALVSQVVLLPLLLGRVGPAVAGTFVLLWSAVNFAAIGIGWLSSGGVVLMTRAAAASDEDGLALLYRQFARIMAGYALIVWLALGAWSLGIGTLWLQTLPPADAAPIRWAAQGAGLYVVAMYVHQADLALLTARMEQGRGALFRVMLQVLMFAGALIGIAVGGGVAGMFGGYAAAAILTALAAHLAIRARGYPVLSDRVSSTSDRPDAMRGILGTFAGYSIVSVLAQYSDMAIIGALGGPATTILFAFLQRLPDAAALLIGRGSESLGPYFTTLAGAERQAERAALYLTSGRVVWRTATVAGIGFAVFGSDIVTWWSRGRLVMPSPLYFAGAGVVITATIVNRHASLLAYYGGHTADATRLAAIELILRAGLVLALFSRAEVQAPMLAALLAQVAVLLVAFRRLEARVLGVPVSRLLDACVKPAALTGAVTLSLMVAFRATGGGSVQGRVAALAFGTVAALGLLVLQERDLGRSFLRRRVA
jgi:hypothetical protein